MYKVIKILKDTPFHSAGTELNIQDFRAAYGWICTNSTTNDQLIKYLEVEWKFNQVKPYQKDIGDWFQVVEKFEEEPLCFVHEDLWYVKDFDGMYTAFVSPMFKEKWVDVKKHESACVKRITIPEARRLIQESKYKNTVLVCTNYVNKQGGLK